MDALHAWLSIECSAFGGDQRPQSQNLAPVAVPLPEVPAQPSPASSVPGSNLLVPVPQSVSAAPIPPTSIPQSSSLCQMHLHVMCYVQALPLHRTGHLTSWHCSTSVSSPFVDLRGLLSHPEAGPVRLTRFVDMSLENLAQ